MASTGIRELRDQLSRYIRRVESGERIGITAHGRVVAELVPAGTNAARTPSCFDHLATAELLGEPPLVTFMTRDSRVRENARALGYSVE